MVSNLFFGTANVLDTVSKKWSILSAWICDECFILVSYFCLAAVFLTDRNWRRSIGMSGQFVKRQTFTQYAGYRHIKPSRIVSSFVGFDRAARAELFKGTHLQR